MDIRLLIKRAGLVAAVVVTACLVAYADANIVLDTVDLSTVGIKQSTAVTGNSVEITVDGDSMPRRSKGWNVVYYKCKAPGATSLDITMETEDVTIAEITVNGPYTSMLVGELVLPTEELTITCLANTGTITPTAAIAYRAVR